MALLFGGATSHVVNHGSGASLDNFTAHTLLAWIYPTSLAATKFFCSKEVDTTTTFDKEWNVRTTGQINTFFNSSGTDPTARSANSAGNVVTLNTWWFVACSLTSGLVPHIYLGNWTTAMAEVSYTTQTTGTGTLTDESAGNFLGGNSENAVDSFVGRIGHISYWNVALTLAQIEAQRIRQFVDTGCVLSCQYGFDPAASSQNDFSGNANHGTVTGATLAAHHPYIVPAASICSSSSGIIRTGSSIGGVA